ncbi:MAG: hypothetical protein JW768_12050 [Chitinispirillaceae bacterium]|nr:hypothetical protein [Chitinispirillaceae bacterium]
MIKGHFCILIFFHLVAYSFRLTPDQWIDDQPFSLQATVFTESLEPNVPSYFIFDTFADNDTSPVRNNQTLHPWWTPKGDRIPSNLVLPIPSTAGITICPKTYAERIIAYIHRAARLDDAADDPAYF